MPPTDTRVTLRLPQGVILCAANIKVLSVLSRAVTWSAIAEDELPHVPWLNPSEADSCTLSSHHRDPFMAVHSVLMNYISHNFHLCSLHGAEESPVSDTRVNQSAVHPLRLRLSDTSCRWVQTWVLAKQAARNTCTASARVRREHRSMIYTVHFITHHLCINHDRRASVLQQQLYTVYYQIWDENTTDAPDLYTWQDYICLPQTPNTSKNNKW